MPANQYPPDRFHLWVEPQNTFPVDDDTFLLAEPETLWRLGAPNRDFYESLPLFPAAQAGMGESRFYQSLDPV